MNNIIGNVIPLLILAIVFSLIIYKIYRDKKKGKKCGSCDLCPDIKKCSIDSETIKKEMMKLVKES